MEVDPLDTIDRLEEASHADRASMRLNTLVAITIAILATFMGICKVKDDNIVQSMQQAQADKLDHWAYFQARNIREEVADATLEQLRLASPAAPQSAQATYAAAIQRYEALSADQAKKKELLKAQAEQDQKDYDAANYHDDQFDLSDALISIAISLLAMTALTHKRWLYIVALVPTGFGLIMGLAGLLGWKIHPDILIKMLS